MGRNMADALEPTADCIAIEELTLLLEGRRGEERRRAAQTHVKECMHCRAELALFQEFESPTILAGEQPHVDAIAARLRQNSPWAPVPWWKRFWTPGFLAPASIALATVVIAITAGIELRNPTGHPAIPAGHEVTRSQSLEAIAPIGDLDRQPSELQWKPVTGASRYTVRLMEVDRTELWSTTVSQTSVALPQAVREKILPLKTLLWEVTALDDSGGVLASSGFQSFRLLTRAPQ